MSYFCVTYGRQQKNKYYVYFFAVGGEKINPPLKGGYYIFFFAAVSGNRKNEPKDQPKDRPT